MARRRRKSSVSSSEESKLILGKSESIKKKSIKPNSLIINGFPSWYTHYSSNVEPESWLAIIVQFLLLFGTLALCFYIYFWFDHFHYHLTRFYAEHIDDHHAQHVLGHKLIRNYSHNEAFKWFRRSSDQGHAHSAYNLAAGHLSGYRTDVKQGEVRKLLKFAAKNGVQEAKELLIGLCREKPKYCDL